MRCGWGRFYGGSSHPFPIYCLSSGHVLSAFLASDSLASSCPQETLLSLSVRLISNSLPLSSGPSQLLLPNRAKCLPGHFSFSSLKLLLSKLHLGRKLNRKLYTVTVRGRGFLEAPRPTEFPYQEHLGLSTRRQCQPRLLPAHTTRPEEQGAHRALWAPVIYSSLTREIHMSSLLPRNQPCFQFPKSYLQHDGSPEAPTAAVEFQGKPTPFSTRTKTLK